MTISGSPRVEGGPAGDVVAGLVRGLIGAAAPDGRALTPVQRNIVRAVTGAMTGYHVEPDELEPSTADELGALLAEYEQEFRNRIVQFILLAELVLHPIPREVALRVEQYACALGVNENMVRVARRYAEGNLGLAAYDLKRTGYLERWTPKDSEVLHTRAPLVDPFDEDCNDPELYERWRALEGYAPGTLGRRIAEFYNNRGFVYPGHPGSAAPYLAQHDFVHVLADYSSKLEGEFEVFGFIGRADPDPRGFTWLASIIGLFDTGYQDSLGLFRVDVTERWLEREEMAVRLGDALYRGAMCSKDLMGVDYFEHVDKPVEEVRALLGIVEKDAEAVAAGSTSPFDPDWENAMSPYQHEHGTRLADA